jgi:hypothetical protein
MVVPPLTVRSAGQSCPSTAIAAFAPRQLDEPSKFVESKLHAPRIPETRSGVAL